MTVAVSMRGKTGAPLDTKEKFSSVVDTLKVSRSERRAELAEQIRENRLKLIKLLDVPSNIASCGDWSRVQKYIHTKLSEQKDPGNRFQAEKCVERLLDLEEELIEGNLRLVLMVVRRYARGNMGALEEMDFVQEGCEGLLDAVRRFDFSGSRGFLTYAVIRIRKRVLLAMEKQQRLVRMPSHVVKKSIYLKEIIDDFAARNGRFPIPAEIEEETGGSIDWSILLSLTENVVPLHCETGDKGLPLEEQLPGDSPSPEETGLTEAIETALCRLDSRSKFVLVMRYGLLDGEPQTLASISKVLGISIERTRQIEKASISLIADSFTGFNITDWLRRG